MDSNRQDLLSAVFKNQAKQKTGSVHFPKGERQNS